MECPCLCQTAQDLVLALSHVKHGNSIASQHRKRQASLPTRLAGLVVGSLNTSGVGFIKSMTAVERHAELVYAESLFEKVSNLPFGAILISVTAFFTVFVISFPCTVASGLGYFRLPLEFICSRYFVNPNCVVGTPRVRRGCA